MESRIHREVYVRFGRGPDRNRQRKLVWRGHAYLITSSIALQNAVRDEYLPLLSDLLTADGMIAGPLQAVIR